MSANHTRESLQQMKGQAVKDIWHAMIGKPAGIKNTTGLKNSEEIIRAILEAQVNPDFLTKYKKGDSKQIIVREPKEMPPKSGEKKKPGPKPKPKTNPVILPEPKVPKLQAYESNSIPERVSEITRIVVRKLYVENSQYFLNTKTNQLYSIIDGRPGVLCGHWDPLTKKVLDL